MGIWAVVLLAVACAGAEPLLLGTFSRPALVDFAFLDDGHTLLVATGDGLEWWDTVVGRMVRALPLPGLRAMALHLEGDLVALAFSWEVELRRLSDLERLYTFPSKVITEAPQVAFSPNGRVLAIVTGWWIGLWDTTTGREVLSVEARRFGGSTGGFYSVGFLSNSELVVMMYPQVILLWEFLRDAFTVLDEVAWGHKVLVDAKRRTVGYAVRDAEGRAFYRLRAVDTGEVLFEARAAGGTGSWTGLLPTGVFLLPSFDPWQGTGLFALDPESGAPRCCLTCDRGLVPTQAAISPDGDKIAVYVPPAWMTHPLGTLVVYETATCRSIAQFGGWGADVVVAEAALDGRYVINLSRYRIEVWDAAQGELVAELQVSMPNALAMAPGLPLLAVGNEHGREVIVWNWVTGERTWIDLRFTDRAVRLALTPDGNSLVVVHENGALSRWDWVQGTTVWRVEGAEAQALAISPRGDLLATNRPIRASGTGGLKIWNLETGQLLDEVARTDFSSQMFFLGDRELLAAVSMQNFPWYRVFLSPEGRILSSQPLKAPWGDGALLGDGRTLAILEVKGEPVPGAWVHLWDVQRDVPLHRWKLESIRALPRRLFQGFRPIPGTRDVLIYDAKSSIRRFSLNLPPTPPVVAVQPRTVVLGKTVRLCAQAEDPEGGPLVFRWDLGDGTLAEGPCVEHIYGAEGLYALRVTAVDDAGAVAQSELSVRAFVRPPLAPEFVWLPSEPWVMEEVVFLDRSSPKEFIERWAWDFEDGGRAEGPEARHAYAQPGTYTVTLTLAAGGIEETIEKTVVVRDVSYVAERSPWPGLRFYLVRMAPEERAAFSFGRAMAIVRRQVVGEEVRLVLVARGTVWDIRGNQAWIVVTEAYEEVRIGDRVVRAEELSKLIP